jgi:NhaA family Na+:H+ antiporter
VDDIGAVLVIAIFYSTGVAWDAVLASGLILLLSIVANRAGVRWPWAYAVIGVALWAAVLASGVHATIAGVLLAMTIPVRTRVNETTFLRNARLALADFGAAARQTVEDPGVNALSNSAHHAALEELETLCEQAQPPLIRLEHSLHGVVAFVIMPLFALANAGVTLGGQTLRAAVVSPITLGTMLGLLIGKPLGITVLAWLAVRFRIAALPSGVTWRMAAGAGVLGGIGFTMSLFIAGLALGGHELLDMAKVGVLTASLLAGLAGWFVLRRATRPKV